MQSKSLAAAVPLRPMASAIPAGSAEKACDMMPDQPLLSAPVKTAMLGVNETDQIQPLWRQNQIATWREMRCSDVD
jgi:hypothetical protein